MTSLHILSYSQYWQQQVDYRINVSLNDKNHSISGNVSIDYKNNSPNSLDYIWFHLWPNAYKNETTAYAKQIFRDPDGKKRWKEMKDRGFNSVSFWSLPEAPITYADGTVIFTSKLPNSE